MKRIIAIMCCCALFFSCIPVQAEEVEEKSASTVQGNADYHEEETVENNESVKNEKDVVSGDGEGNNAVAYTHLNQIEKELMY